MNHIRWSGLSWAAVMTLCLVTPTPGVAQEDLGGDPRLVAAGSVGRFFEAWEGNSGSVGAWTVMLGYRISERSTIRAEWGPGFEICAKDSGICHRHDRIGRLSIVRRMSPSTYFLFGPIHVGLGATIPVGRGLSVSGEVDASYWFESVSFRPKVTLSKVF